MSSDDEEWRFAVNPEAQPRRSSAYDGYLWKVEATEKIYFITDIAQMAEYEEEEHDREVTIINIRESLGPTSTTQWLEAGED